jgi:Chalcone isomerase like
MMASSYLQLRTAMSRLRPAPYIRARSLASTFALARDFRDREFRNGLSLSMHAHVFRQYVEPAWFSHRSLAGVVLFFGASGCATAQAVQCDVQDPATDIPVPVELPDVVPEDVTQVSYPRSLSAREQLMGVGMRLMTPLKIQVYAIGLYVDASLAAELLQDWRGAGPDFGPAFWTELTNPSSPLTRTLRMKVVREVSGKHMQHGFDRALIPRVRAAASSMGMPGGKDALRKFNAIFKSAGVLRVGTEICIKCTGFDTLVLEINQQHCVTLHNKALVWAVLDMFLGEAPVAPNVKSRVAESFHSLLLNNADHLS